MTRDIAIGVLSVLLVWRLISDNVEPDALMQERAARQSVETQATVVATRANGLATVVARLATPTPRPPDCSYVYPGC